MYRPQVVQSLLRPGVKWCWWESRGLYSPKTQTLELQSLVSGPNVSIFPTRQSVTIQCSTLLLCRILPSLVSPLVACRLAPEGHPTLFSPLNLNVDRLSPASAPQLTTIQAPICRSLLANPDHERHATRCPATYDVSCPQGRQCP